VESTTRHSARLQSYESRHPLASWLSGLVIAYLLLISAIAHIGNPYQFLAAIRSYQLSPLVPELGMELAAIVLPFLHLALALCLITGHAQREALRISGLLFLFYAIIQTTAWARGLQVNCGCFGPSEELIGIKSIGLALGASLICLFGWWVSQPRSHTFVPQKEALEQIGET
jgi:hypothetical protein